MAQSISRYSNEPIPMPPMVVEAERDKKVPSLPSFEWPEPEIQPSPEVDKRPGIKKKPKEKSQRPVSPYNIPEIDYTEPTMGELYPAEADTLPVTTNLAVPSFLDTYRQIQPLIDSSLDGRAADAFTDRMAEAIWSGDNTAYGRNILTAVDESYDNGVNDLNEMLGSTGYQLGDMKKTRSSLRKLLDSDAPAERHSPSDIDDYTQSLSSIRKDTTDKIRQINTPREQGNFVRQMQGSNDQTIQQMLQDAIQQTSPQALAFLTGDTQSVKGLPPALLKKQSEALWRTLSENVALGVDSQMEALLQNDAGNYTKALALQQAFDETGNFNPQLYQQAILQSMGKLQNRLNTIQQIHDAVFRTKNQPMSQRTPIRKEAVKSFRLA